MVKKLYVGNLSHRVTEDDLKTKFDEIGQYFSIKIIMDKFSGESKGFAFVEMATEEAALDAIKKLNGISMYGRGIVVNEAQPKKPRKSGFKGRGRY
jgi:RNA recognition motif-containing protein